MAGAAVLPAGTELPPLAYLVGLAMGTLIVGVLLLLMRPPVRGWDVLALGSWMAVGSALHALHEIGAFPEWLAPLFGAPAVYFTTATVAGAVWLFATVGAAAGIFGSIPRLVGVLGANVAIVFVAFIAWQGVEGGTLEPVWPVVALAGSMVVAAVAFVGLSLTYTEAVAVTGKAGAFVVFGHTLDGLTTAVGIDVLGVEERSPLPEAIMEFSGDLPTAAYIGSGWLFVLVKAAMALLVVSLLADYVRESESRGNLALAGVAAVGFGPGFYNMLLFLVTAGP
ncbi:DUF63 domain-containing protein [Halobacteriales archaeon QS_1_68_20]|nr:MAG: DUF63 domain-containing protein [Halobacteriales archaeon QS_1_68_20]